MLLTIKHLKDVLMDWPELNEDGTPTQVWVGTLDGKHSNEATGFSRLDENDILIKVGDKD